MTPPQQRGLPSEEDVRSLVERILDGVVESTEPSPDNPAVTGTSEVAPSAIGKGGNIAIGADHGGYPLKERIAFKLKEAGWEVVDCGTDSHESVDYPDFAHAVAKKVASEECQSGIVIDGAGIGSAITANKVPGIRAATCYDISSARNSREHNHANVLSLGAGLIGEGLAWQIVEEWLATEWAGGRHARRVSKIDAIEKQYSGPEWRHSTDES
jgi:ribose 5-phosphate isomerase B